MIGIRGVAKKPIIDATALPGDVLSGKIFYNNDGRQTGTFEVPVKKLIATAKQNYSTTGYNCTGLVRYDGSGIIRSINGGNSQSPYITVKNYIDISGKQILYFRIPSMTNTVFNCLGAGIGIEVKFSYTESHGYKEISLYNKGNTLYFYNSTGSDQTIEIYYIDK